MANHEKSKEASTLDHKAEKRALVRWSCEKVTPDMPDYLGCSLESLDWDWLVRAADAHRLGPLLGYRLAQNSESWALLPSNARRQLAEILAKAQERYRRCSSEIGMILNRLRNDGIPTVVLKGLTLAGLYPEAYLRRFGDLDLFVPEDELERARVAVLDLGYGLPSAGTELKALDTFTFHLGRYVRTGSPLKVEIHAPRHIGGPGFGHFGLLDMTEWMENARPTVLCGVSALMLCREDELLFLCDHLRIHHGKLHGRTVKSVLDIYLVIQQGVDWPVFLSNVRRCTQAEAQTVEWVQREVVSLSPHPTEAEWEWVKTDNITARIYYALACVNELYGAVVPTSILDATRPRDEKLLGSVSRFSAQESVLKQLRYSWTIPCWNRILDFPDISDSIQSLVEMGILKLWLEYVPMPMGSEEASELWRRAPRVRPKLL